MKKIIGDLYWTSQGFAYRVDSPEKARIYNRRLAIFAVTMLAVIVLALIIYVIPAKG